MVSPKAMKCLQLTLLALSLGAASASLRAAGPASPTGPVKVYCCDVDGKRVCGDQLPPQCYSRAHHEISAGGTTKEIGAPLTPEQKAQAEAEENRKKKEAAKAAEQRRRDAALVASYGSEKDIDSKRDKAIAEAQKALKQAEDSYAAALKRKQALDHEAEFYAKNAVPERLTAQLQEAQTELAAQEAAVAEQKREIEDIRSRFEEEKKRYIRLTRGAPEAPATDNRPR